MASKAVPLASVVCCHVFILPVPLCFTCSFCHYRAAFLLLSVTSAEAFSIQLILLILLICRTTRFDKDDVPDLSRLGRKSLNEPYGKSEPYSRRSDDYGSRSDTYGRDSHREGSSADNSFSAVREKVQMGIATSHSHTEMLQDMVLNLSEGASRRDADHDKTVLKDLVKEMVTFRYCTDKDSRTAA